MTYDKTFFKKSLDMVRRLCDNTTVLWWEKCDMELLVGIFVIFLAMLPVIIPAGIVAWLLVKIFPWLMKVIGYGTLVVLLFYFVLV